MRNRRVATTQKTQHKQIKKTQLNQINKLMERKGINKQHLSRLYQNQSEANNTHLNLLTLTLLIAI